MSRDFGTTNRDRAVAALLAARRWLTIEWLPAYAPELNLMERVWRHLKDKLSCHRWWADLDALEAATATLLARLEARFHQPHPGGIALVHNSREAA